MRQRQARGSVGYVSHDLGRVSSKQRKKRESVTLDRKGRVDSIPAHGGVERIAAAYIPSC